MIDNCTYSIPGQYYPLVSVMNNINLINQSIHIDVETALSAFQVEIENRLDINQLALVTIRALEQITYEGLFNLTIINNLNEKNKTKIENVRLLQSNDFTEQIYMNITTYGRQILHVRGGDYPTIREAQVIFSIGTDIKIKPQVYIINSIGLINEDIIWIDIQWINGIGFDIQINYGNENKIILYYGQFITSSINQLIKKNEKTYQIQWKRIADKRLQIGYK